MKHVFIINPTAGEGKYQRVVSWIEENFTEQNFSIHITKYPGHAKEIAAMYEDNTVLYAVGGDGTAFEVVNGMSFKNELAVIPVGTGNDFVKMIPYDKDITNLLEDTVFKGHVQRVDVGQANEHLFLNAANVGADAGVVANAAKFKVKNYVPKTLVYVAAALKEAILLKPIKLEVFNNDFRRNKDYSLLAIMNGQYYGSAFRSAPSAKLDDGILNIVMIDEVSRLKAVPLLPRYVKGNHVDLDIVELKEVKDLKIDFGQKRIYVCDGEIFEDDKLEISVHPKKLKYRLPQGVSL